MATARRSDSNEGDRKKKSRKPRSAAGRKSGQATPASSGRSAGRSSGQNSGRNSGQVTPPEPPPPLPAPPSPPPGLGPARRELLAIQMRLWRRLQRDVDESIEEVPPNIAIYQEEYERDVVRHEAISSKAELVEAATRADIVFVGDYHTLPQAQQTLVKLLLAVTRVRPDVVLALELVHTDAQRALDRFMAGKTTEERFLREVDYERTWGFPWPPYREVLEVARARGVRVVGINANPEGQDATHLLDRDFSAAEVIVKEIVRRPDALVIVFDGDLHVARDHLPLIVDTLLARRGQRPRRRLIVHQNAERVHWTLARAGTEHVVNVVRLAPDAYCVQNASPLEKLHSYLNWVGARETLVPPEASSWEMDAYGGVQEDLEDAHDPTPEYTEQVLALVQVVARFLEVTRDDLDSFQLFTVNDLDFLDHLQSSGRYTEIELDDIKRQILSNESYFVPKGDIIYLSDFSVANAAEEGTHFLHHRCSGYRWERPRDLVTDFYFRCVTEALGYFGSKLIVPTRPSWTERDCERLVEAARRRRARARRLGEARAKKPGAAAAGPVAPVDLQAPTLQHNRASVLRACRLVLQHRALERGYLETRAWSSAGSALTQSAEVHLLITHMLGHMLGDKLYAGVASGAIEKRFVRELFHERIEGRGVALARYLELVEATEHLQQTRGRADSL